MRVPFPGKNGVGAYGFHLRHQGESAAARGHLASKKVLQGTRRCYSSPKSGAGWVKRRGDEASSAVAEENGEMTPQDWESPAAFTAPTGRPAQESPELAAAYALRPLSTGEVLDRTFSIYRSRFWLFAGISSLSGAVQLVANAFNLAGQHLVMTRYGFRAAALGSSIGSMLGVLLFLLAVSVTQAATVHALSEVYLGRGATVSGSLRPTIRLWYRYVGIALWQGWSAIWVPLVLILPAVYLVRLLPGLGLSWVWFGGVLIFVEIIGGGVYGAIAYLRNSLGVQAAVVEQSTVRASMRRSKILTSGTKGRIFLVLLITAALYWVGGEIQLPMLFFVGQAPLEPHVMAQAVILAVSFVTHTLVSPVALIGLSLVYFDQRVRREAFDLVMLLGGEVPAPALTGEAATVAAPADHSAEAGGDTGEPIGNDDRV